MADLCPECGVPTYISGQHRWLNNGDIVNATRQDERLTFMECEHFDPIFRRIEQEIKTSIERIVLTTNQAAVRVYIESLLPKEIGDMIRAGTLDLKTVDENLIELAKLNGYGKYEFVDMRYEKDEGDYYTTKLTKPFSHPIGMATHGAALEAMLGYDHEIRYTQSEPDVYEVTAFPHAHEEELKDRLLENVPYQHQDGDLEFEMCSSCGAPKRLSNYKWVVEEGQILNRATGRRVSLSGPNTINPVFRELEFELGDQIPRLITDEMRRITREGFLPAEILNNEEDLRWELAIRGLGNLRRLSMDAGGLELEIGNACLPVIVVGAIQGMYEANYDVDTQAEWELTEEGTLEIKYRLR
jgi:hypothetical protein